MTGAWRRVAEAAAVLAGVTVAVVWLSGGCGERIAPGRLPEAARPTDATVEVERRLDTAREWTSGAVESARRTAVASRILARIEEVRVKAGSEVEAGDLLVRLDARDLAARVAEAEEALGGARAALALARTENERAEKLLAEGAVSQQRVDQTRSAQRQARAEVDALEERVREVRTGLSFAEIRAPVGGRVVDRLAEPGDTAVPGQPLLRIYDPSLLRVEVPVRESLAVRLSVGEVLTVEVPALDRRFDGVIDEIVPFAEPGARTLLVKVRLPSDPRLFAGMFARAAVPAGEVERLVAPAAAVERVGQLEFVDVVPADGGPAHRRLVTTGRALGDGRVEILSGVRAGELLALGGAS